MTANTEQKVINDTCLVVVTETELQAADFNNCCRIVQFE